MNTEQMSHFLGQIGAAHLDHHVVMALDSASSHKAKALEVPQNVSLVHLPPYSPELNPVEILWHELREKYCSNRVFETLSAVQQEVASGCAAFSSSPGAVTKLSGWSWIIKSIQLNAT
ncbi:MAG: transposase [Desulfobacteraceae bacterium]|nr:transposase [Desulfobacteraceae bacterium]